MKWSARSARLQFGSRGPRPFLRMSPIPFAFVERWLTTRNPGFRISLREFRLGRETDDDAFRRESLRIGSVRAFLVLGRPNRLRPDAQSRRHLDDVRALASLVKLSKVECVRSMEIGERLNELEALHFAEALGEYDGTTDLVIDFSRTQHFEPFGMLLLGSAIRQAAERAACGGGSVRLPCDGVNPDNIAAHMGFWQSIGMPLGREVNSPSAKNSYVSVSRLDVGQLMREAGNCLPLAIYAIEKEANRLAAVLVPRTQHGMYDALRYARRRGVVCR
jgi:hypothetical protein